MHPAFSPLSDKENIVWLIFELLVETFQLVLILYFLIHTVRFIRRNSGKNSDTHSMCTLLLLCVGCFMRVAVMLLNDVITLSYYLDSSESVQTDLSKWFVDNHDQFTMWVDDIHLFGIHIRNYAFFINLARWYLIIKQNKLQREFDTNEEPARLEFQTAQARAKKGLVLAAALQLSCWLLSDLLIITDKDSEQLIRRFI